MSSLIFYTIIMAAYIPFTYGQSTTGLTPVSEVVASVVASRSATATSSAAATSAVTTPTLKFDAVGTLTACGTTQLYWNITGLDTALYDMSLRAIDADADDATRASSPAAASLTSRASSISTSRIPTSATVSVRPTSTLTPIASALSTALVGRREVQVRQSATGNLTIADGHNAQEPITFTVTLPPGRYYFAGRLNTNPRTAANSNVFRVVEGSDMSCLSGAVSTTSTRTSGAGTSRAGTQTAGSASNAVESSSISGGAIAGIVIGVLGGLAVLGALLFFCMKKKRRQDRGLNENRFSNLPSASSHDGGEYGHDQGNRSDPYATPPIAGAWRRNSDPDEKVIEDSPPIGDRRKQAGPPTSHILTEKKSTQGFIGKGSNESSAIHSRSSSIGGAGDIGGVATGGGGSGGGAKVGRSTSTRRKPVPSLGPELRNELERERKMSAGAGAHVPEPKRKSYSLVPDMPTQQK